MEQDRATPDFHYPVFLWVFSRNMHEPTLVSCSCSIPLYRQAAIFFNLCLRNKDVFLVCFLWHRAWARAAIGYLRSCPSAGPPNTLGSRAPPSLSQNTAQILHSQCKKYILYYTFIYNNQDSQSKP